MPALGASFPDLIAVLRDRYGLLEPPGAGLEPFAALVATFLDRLTDSRKALAALNALRDDGLLDVQALAESDPSEVTESLRSAGVKIPEKSLAPLRKLARWLVERHHGSVDGLDDGLSTSQLREELLGLNGVGPATADALLLFAFQRPAYPVDRATYRILVRHGWLDPFADYDEARSVVEGQAPDDSRTLTLLSGWLERLGRDHCRASVAKCDRCPLAPFLPEGGPIDPSA
jgi:endonuclease III related protein